MGWPYHFDSLSPEQISERRNLLDLYGFYAWLSPIILFACIHLGKVLLARYPSTLNRQSSSKSPTFSQHCTRRLLWILDTPLPTDFGTLRVHLIGLLYTSWLLFLTVHRTGTDYMHFTKRLGHVAVSQLPLQYLLSIKSPLSPIQFVTGLSHESLNPYHRLSGRVIHLFLLAHATLYLNFFFAISALPRRLYDREVQLGIAAIIILTILAASARPTIRKAAYHRNFYIPHAFLSFLLIPVIAAHVPYTRRYIIQVLALYLFNVVTRKLSTTAPASTATITSIDGTNDSLLQISIPATELTFGSPIPTWIPGQHVYLKSGQNPTYPRSPFTIASIPPVLPNAADSERNYRGYEIPPMELMVRSLGGPTTTWLAGAKLSISDSSHSKEDTSNGDVNEMIPTSLHSTSQKINKVDVLVEGPYGSSSIVASLFSSISDQTSNMEGQEEGGVEEVLLIAGGVGATFTLPIYVSLMTAQVQAKAEGGEPDEGKSDENSAPTSKRIRFHFHWIVRSRAEAAWGLAYLHKALASIRQRDSTSREGLNIKIHVTSRADAETDSLIPRVPTQTEDFTESTKGSILTPSTSEDEPPIKSSLSPSAGIQILTPGTRPNLRSLIDSVFHPSPAPDPTRQTNQNPDLNSVSPQVGQRSAVSTPPNHRITALVCAPPALTSAIRGEVGLHVLRYGRDIRWHEESFGMGV